MTNIEIKTKELMVKMNGGNQGTVSSKYGIAKDTLRLVKFFDNKDNEGLVVSSDFLKKHFNTTVSKIQKALRLLASIGFIDRNINPGRCNGYTRNYESDSFENIVTKRLEELKDEDFFNGGLATMDKYLKYIGAGTKRHEISNMYKYIENELKKGVISKSTSIMSKEVNLSMSKVYAIVRGFSEFGIIKRIQGGGRFNKYIITEILYNENNIFSKKRIIKPSSELKVNSIVDNLEGAIDFIKKAGMLGGNVDELQREIKSLKDESTEMMLIIGMISLVFEGDFGVAIKSLIKTSNLESRFEILKMVDRITLPKE